MARPRNSTPTRPTAQADREKAEVYSDAELTEIGENRAGALNADPSAAGAGREAVTVLRVLMREELAAAGAGKIKPSTSRTRTASIAAMLAKASEPEKRIETLTNDLRELGDEVKEMKSRRGSRITGPTPTAPASGDITVQ